MESTYRTGQAVDQWIWIASEFFLPERYIAHFVVIDSIKRSKCEDKSGIQGERWETFPTVLRVFTNGQSKDLTYPIRTVS